MAHPVEGGAVLRDVKACVFDAYGTLFDFGSAAAALRDELGDEAAALTALWRDKQLSYTWLRAVQDRHADFWQVTGEALDYALETLGIVVPGARERLMRLYLTLAPFPEAAQMLSQLKRAGLAVAILSNGTPAMLSSLVDAARFGPMIDAVLSVEEVGVYKPHRRVYQLAVDRLGVLASGIVFLSSNAWDAHAASAFGMRVVWCNRYGQRRERLPGDPDRTLVTLAGLPALLGITPEASQ
jgi:2-haloacid dehalogenase